MSDEFFNDDETSENSRNGPSSAGADLIIPVAGCLFTLYYFWTILDAPWTAQVSAFFMGALLILCSVIMIAKTALAVRQGKTKFGFEILIEPRDYLLKRIALLVLTLGFIIVIQFAGYTLTTFVFLTAAIVLLNGIRNLRQTVILAAGLAISGWALFVIAFEIRFPAGPFEMLMERIL